MLTSFLLVLGMSWYSVQLVPGVTETLGYVFGLLIAPYIYQACFAREVS